MTVTRGQPPAPAAPTRSASYRYGPGQPYWSPTEVVLPQDYDRRYGDGATDLAGDLPTMVSQAQAAGNQRTGMPILFRPGRYPTSAPLVLPRNGPTPTTVVHVLGTAMRTSIVEGLPTFPTGHGLIEWAASTSQVWHGRIADLTLHAPLVAGTRAVYHKKNGAGTALADYQAEWLQCDLERLLIEADNRYHEALIDLEVGLRQSRVADVFGDPARSEDGSSVHGTYDTLLLRTPTQRGGVDPGYVDEDSFGIGFCHISNLWPMVRRGGWSKAFEGRVYESTWDGCFANGGHYERGDNYRFVNSGMLDLRNLLTEGKGERTQFAFSKCENVDLTNCSPIVPQPAYAAWQAGHAYAGGDRVAPTRLTSGQVSPSAYFFEAGGPGTSGGAEPAWPNSQNATVADNGIVWTAIDRAVGDGIAVDGGCRNVRWRGRRARPANVPFSLRLGFLATVASGAVNVLLDDFDVRELSAGSAADEFDWQAAVGSGCQASGDGVQGDGTRTVYVLGSNARHPIDAGAAGIVTLVTADATPTAQSQTLRVDASGGQVTITLPLAAGIGTGIRYLVKRWNSGANAVVVQRGGTEVIDGAAAKTLGSQYAAIDVESDVAGRWIVHATMGTVT